MKFVKRIVLLFLFISGFMNPVFGNMSRAQDAADSVQILRLLKKRDQQIKSLLGPKGSHYTQQQKNKLKDIINGIVDYNALAAVALQKTYDTLSTKSRKEFVNVFSDVVRSQSLNNLNIYRAHVDYKNIDVNKGVAKVKTLATLDKTRTPVNYQMKKENGQWFITDIILDDVSTAESYKRSFQNIIRKKGYGFLLKTLKKKAAK